MAIESPKATPGSLVPPPEGEPALLETLRYLGEEEGKLKEALADAPDADRPKIEESLRVIQQQLEAVNAKAQQEIMEGDDVLGAPPKSAEGENKVGPAVVPEAPAAEATPERPEIITSEDRKAIRVQVRTLLEKVEQGTEGDEALQLARQLAHLQRAGLGLNPTDRKRVFGVLDANLDRFRNPQQAFKLAQYLTYRKYMGAQETIDQGDASLIRFAIQTQIERGDTQGLSQLCMYAKFIGAQDDFKAAQPLLQADFTRTRQSGDAEAAAYELARRKYVGLAHSTAQRTPPYGQENGKENYAPGEAIEGTVPEQTLDDLGVHERLGQLRQDGKWQEFARLRLVADYVRGARGLDRETRQQLKAHAPILVGKARDNGRWAIPVSYLADVRQLFRRTRDITPRELTDLTREEIEKWAAEQVQPEDAESVLAGRETRPTEEDKDTVVRAGNTVPLPKVEAAPRSEEEASALFAEKMSKRREERKAKPMPETVKAPEQPDFQEVIPVPATPSEETEEGVEQSEAPAGWWSRVREWFRGTPDDGQKAAGRAETGIESPAERAERITAVLNAAAVTLPSGETRSYIELISDAKQRDESLADWIERHHDIAQRLEQDLHIPVAEAWQAVEIEEEIVSGSWWPREVTEERTTSVDSPVVEEVVEPVAEPTPAAAATKEAVQVPRWPREPVEQWTDEQRDDLTDELKSDFKYTKKLPQWSLYDDIVYYQKEKGLTFEQWEQYALKEIIPHMEEKNLPPAEAWVLIEIQRQQSST